MGSPASSGVLSKRCPVAKAPWFAFNVHDWLTSIDVQRMTLAEVGAYTNLLARAWDSDPIATLPNDPAKLWKLAGARSLAEFEEVAPAVLGMFEEQDGRLINRRLLEETARLAVAENIRVEKARNAASARWGKNAQACSNIDSGCSSNACDARDAKQRTETDSVKESKPSQLVTESEKSESACFLSGSQSRSTQPGDAVAPPTQSLSGDRFALALDVLQREEPGEENPIAWGQRMAATWHAIRMEKRYSSDYPEEVSSQDFQKLISPTWLVKAGFREPLSRAEIQLCLQWALRTSTHWSKRNVLLGSAGFVNAFGSIKRQCFNYHASKETRNREVGKKEKSAHPRISLETQPLVTVVKPALPDDCFKSALQEIRDMRTDSASVPFGSSKWKGLRFRELTSSGECSPSAAEIQIENEMKEHEANQAALRQAVRERGQLSASEISTMLASKKVRPEDEEFEKELSGVADL